MPRNRNITSQKEYWELSRIRRSTGNPTIPSRARENRRAINQPHYDNLARTGLSWSASPTQLPISIYFDNQVVHSKFLVASLHWKEFHAGSLLVVQFALVRRNASSQTSRHEHLKFPWHIPKENKKKHIRDQNHSGHLASNLNRLRQSSLAIGIRGAGN